MELRAILAGTLPSARGVGAMPFGGERAGGVYVCGARTDELGPTVEHEVVALFKAFHCLAGEFPYEAWAADGPEVEFCSREFLQWRSNWSPPTGPSFVEHLADACKAVLEAQCSPFALNPPWFLTGDEGGGVGFEVSDVVRAENLVLGIDGRWNSLTGLFRTPDRAFLVEWWTNA